MILRLLLALCLLLGANQAFAGTCDDPGQDFYSAPVAVGSATTALLIARPTRNGQAITVCAFSATLTGTTPTALIIAGTQVTNPCDTSPTSLTGTFAPTSGTLLIMGWGGDGIEVPPGQQLCVTTGGTTPSLQGVITYTIR